MMKTRLLLSLAAFVPGIYLVQSTGSASVAVIDFDRVVADTPEGKDAISKLNAFGTERRTAIENKVKQADELADRVREQGRVLSDAARTQLTKDLQTAQTEIETMQEEAQNKLNQMRQELLVPVEAKTARAVSAYASERGLKIVLDASVLRDGLVYVHDTADLTSEIIRRIAADVRKSGPPYALFPPRHSSEDPMARAFDREWFQGDFLNRNLHFASEAE